MRYPHFLPENGSIGFIAPSFGAVTEPYRSAFLNARTKFEAMGYRCVTGPNAFVQEGVGISNTPEACAAEVNDFFTRKDTDILLSLGGGELMCTILDDVDFPALRAAAPKWFMGFSDNTNLTFLLPTLCDTAAIYGPNAPAFGMEPWHPALFDAFDLLTGKRAEFENYDRWQYTALRDEEHPLLPYHLDRETKLRCFCPDAHGDMKETEAPLTLRGRLLGGCLDVLRGLAGTSYDRTEAFLRRYPDEPLLWFFESCDLNVFDMERSLWQLEHCGWFSRVGGFLIGRPLHFDEPLFGLDQYAAVLHRLEKYRVPIIMDADFGHLPPALPLVSGALATVARSGNTLRLSYDFH
ncbi:LD-carboxypeptidase [Stomatobaculum longum]|uniref:S66 family peptidase n=1 Tax=Stomatobaculum longum TaxID=796942 RepID=UPI002803E654|nr:LD-carboxypeptidase [Stomatobaculum longum]